MSPGPGVTMPLLEPWMGGSGEWRVRTESRETEPEGPAKGPVQAPVLGLVQYTHVIVKFRM